MLKGSPAEDEQDAHPTSFADGRYVVLRMLGEGGQKTVYLVHDNALDRECALSLPRRGQDDPDAVRRFEQEAHAALGLRGNPYVVNVVELGCEGGVPYVVTEYVKGENLQAEVARHRPAVPVRRILEIAVDVARAMEAVHGCGLVHRDVAPRNVWIDERGHAKLGDFGLAARDGTHDGRPVGTPAYMAPEQALGEPCDARSDLYSLGAVMYEMATGRPPFVADDPTELLAQHIGRAPVPPRWHNPEIPPSLERLILSLLEKVPDDRPATAEAVLSALDSLQATLHDRDATQLATPPRRFNPDAFAGRAAELAALRNAYDAATRGRGQVVLIEGVAGAGKSRLVEQLATYVRLRGGAVRWGRCSGEDAAPPYWPWVQALRTHAEATDSAMLVDDLGLAAGRIGQIMPELARRCGVSVERAGAGDDARTKLFEAVAAWVKRSASRQALMIVVDDLHWSDPSSLLLLEHLARSLRRAPVLIIGAYRTEETGGQESLGSRLANGIGPSRALRFRIQGLTASEVTAYLESATGEEPSPEVVAKIHERTEGNPLFLTEALRLMGPTGVLDGNQTPLPIPPSVHDVLLSRLAGLSPGCRDVIAAAAVVGRTFESSIVGRVCGETRANVADALGEAEVAHIALPLGQDGRDGAFKFSHVLVRDVLYDELGVDERARMHAAVADALEESESPDAPETLSAIAHHLRLAATDGDESKAVDFSIRAGEAARRMYAYEEALVHWDAAIRLIESSGAVERQAELLERASDIVWLAGVGYERGIAYLERALDLRERVGDPQRTAITHSRLGRALGTYAGLTDIQRSIRHYEAALRLLADEPSVVRATVCLGLGIAQGRALQIDAALSSAREARTIAETIASRGLLLLARRQEGMALFSNGRIREGVALQDHAWRMARTDADPIARFASAWTRSFNEREFRGDPRRAVSLVLRELNDRRIADAWIQRKTLMTQLAGAYFVLGDRERLEALDLADEDLGPLLSDFDGHWEISLALALQKRATHRAEGNRVAEGWWTRNAAINLMSMGRLDEAASTFGDAVRLCAGRDVPAELRARGLLCVVEAERGNVESAQRELSRCDEIIGEGEDWRGQAGRIELARAATFSGRSLQAEAELAFARSIQLLQQYELRWDEAEACRLWGRSRAATGDDAGALKHFRSSIQIYRRISAGIPWMARVVREYARSGPPDAERTWS
jgi:tetratricopeptide (TPR) repeat protein